MKRPGLQVAALCLIAGSCGEDPAKSVKVVARPPQPAAAAAAVTGIATPAIPAAPPAPSLALPAKAVSATVKAAPSSGLESNWLSEVCPPAHDSPGLDAFIAKGPCGFRQREAVSCEDSRDDLYVAFTRKSSHGATLVFYLNVENYHGPGVYDGGEMFLAAQSDTTIYRWSNDNVHVTVGPNVSFIALDETRLEGEPMLVDCTLLIGPTSNYQYQCGGRSTANVAINGVAEVVSGKLPCAGRRQE